MTKKNNETILLNLGYGTFAKKTAKATRTFAEHSSWVTNDLIKINDVLILEPNSSHLEDGRKFWGIAKSNCFTTFDKLINSSKLCNVSKIIVRETGPNKTRFENICLLNEIANKNGIELYGLFEKPLVLTSDELYELYSGFYQPFFCNLQEKYSPVIDTLYEQLTNNKLFINKIYTFRGNGMYFSHILGLERNGLDAVGSLFDKGLHDIDWILFILEKLGSRRIFIKGIESTANIVDGNDLENYASLEVITTRGPVEILLRSSWLGVNFEIIESDIDSLETGATQLLYEISKKNLYQEQISSNSVHEGRFAIISTLDINKERGPVYFLNFLPRPGIELKCIKIAKSCINHLPVKKNNPYLRNLIRGMNYLVRNQKNFEQDFDSHTIMFELLENHSSKKIVA